MHPRVRWPPHAWIWSAGILTCLVGASGVAVMVRAPTPDAAVSATDDSSSDIASSAILPPSVRIAKAGAARAPCTECGTITSIREVASAAAMARREISEARRDHGIMVAPSTRALAAAEAGTQVYEITIRFRDGRTSVFTEPGPPTWRVGSRIVLIAGATQRAN
jgi:hypothetical protein